ncbi:HNH endonuclease [Microbulbifer sp. 2201CG32-9]|uniref:HNH endonuclease n=1 Tax=Microbulbifer sp. 2201CG32-9 TaxID=3232309 RepID=UPI00345C25CB
MPQKAKRPCRKCKAAHSNANGYCDSHQQQATNWHQWQRERGSSAKRGYGAKWRRLRAIIIERDSGLCQACKAEGKYQSGSHVDHITPKAQGGTDEPHNLQLLCVEHHKRKTAQEGKGARREGRG